MSDDLCGFKDEDEIFRATFGERKLHHQLIANWIAQRTPEPEVVEALKALFSKMINNLKNIYVEKHQHLTEEDYDDLVYDALARCFANCKAKGSQEIRGRSITNMVIWFIRDCIHRHQEKSIGDEMDVSVPVGNIVSYFFDYLFDLNQLSQIDNEASLQLELGHYLRQEYLTVALEKNVGTLFGSKSGFSKKEIDIVIFEDIVIDKPTVAIELKYPRNGQYPEQMYKIVQHIKFCEELKAAGCKQAYVLVLIDDHNFCQGNKQDGIYAYFRNQRPLTGRINKPTGNRNQFIELSGTYSIEWQDIEDTAFKYALIEI